MYNLYISFTMIGMTHSFLKLDTILEDGINDPEKAGQTIDNTLHLMNNLTSSTPELSAGDISSSIDILEKIVNVTNSSGSSIAQEVYFFDCSFFLVPLDNCSVIWRRRHYQ